MNSGNHHCHLLVLTFIPISEKCSYSSMLVVQNERLAKECDEFVKLLQQAQLHLEMMVFIWKNTSKIQGTLGSTNQKLLEEVPSPALTPELRKAMGDAAIATAASIGYIGVGTVEFLLDERGQFYFMQRNTRIQEEQIHVAVGEKLCMTQSILDIS
uniref:Carbamoyl phosphate synthase ATP-binding domain-containing protein n=1 Tax=Lactuca sativa TaxID=4236 RepID=A0A9R1WLK8_LACSA|nr:hypothetical protein LSAT_V11C100019030 [Lactuca sativa]